MWRDDANLLDMLIWARRASGYVAGTTLEQFLSSTLVQDATIRCLLVLGEAAGRVSAEFRDAHPEIQWPSITGMRNRLVHEYGQHQPRRRVANRVNGLLSARSPTRAPRAAPRRHGSPRRVGVPLELQPLHPLEQHANPAQERPRIEGVVELVGGQRAVIVVLEQLAVARPLAGLLNVVPDHHRIGLHDRIRVLARDAGVDELKQHAARVNEPARRLEVAFMRSG